MNRNSKPSRRKFGRAWIGTSGWSYAHWRKVFYPEHLPAGSWFTYYARYFDTVEINSSFYDLPAPGTMREWKETAPHDFVFSAKALREITHDRELRGVKRQISRMVKGLSILGRRLGPILFELPPRLEYNSSLLSRFLEALPPRRRYALEFRNAGWINEDAMNLLSSRRVAVCIHDFMEVEVPPDLTTPFGYFKFYGAGAERGRRYPRSLLTRRAEAMKETIASGRDVYAYFENDARGNAVKDAVALRKILAELIDRQVEA
jgi:uncharacterized protein YecE (DUF72 family)